MNATVCNPNCWTYLYSTLYMVAPVSPIGVPAGKLCMSCREYELDQCSMVCALSQVYVGNFSTSPKLSQIMKQFVSCEFTKPPQCLL